MNEKNNESCDIDQYYQMFNQIRILDDTNVTRRV